MKAIPQIGINIIVTGIVLLLMVPACGKSREKHEGTRVPKEEQEKRPIQDEMEAGADSSIGHVDALTPEIFVRITIQYRKAHKKWLQEAQKLPPVDREGFIEKANREFFERIGITEEQYINFSRDNIDALNAYIAEHPELLPYVMDY